jgi:hypothetical protein
LSRVVRTDIIYWEPVPYHKGPGVKKSGPKGPNKIKGDVLRVLLEEFDVHPSDPSHLIAERVSGRTGVVVSSRRVREIRQGRGKSRSSMRSSMAASHPPSLPTSSYHS